MTKLHNTFGDLQQAIKSARDVARREAEEECGKGFVQSRGVWMVTCGEKAGLVAPNAENVYSGKAPTAADFNALIADIEANYPAVDYISFEGGFDFAERMDGFRDGAYDAWVSDWSVEAWRRPGTRNVDALVSMHSGFSSLADMLNAHPSYTPTLATTRAKDPRECAELKDIADAYDAAQAAKGDARRAYRY